MCECDIFVFQGEDGIRDRLGTGVQTCALPIFVYVSTQNGLWRSKDGVNFALYQPARDAENSDEILSNTVYTAVHDRRSYYGQALWVGTPDGLARTPDPNSNESIWRIFRTEMTPQQVYAYPNPFSPYSDNILDGDGYEIGRAHV